MTLDIFKDYDPGPVVERFDPEQTKGHSLHVRLAKAISLCLGECGMDREIVAARMTELLDERVSKQMLDNYASPSKEHLISATRLAALVQVTDDIRPLNELLRDAGLIATPARYEILLRRERARELADKMNREADAADAEWRAKR